MIARGPKGSNRNAQRHFKVLTRAPEGVGRCTYRSWHRRQKVLERASNGTSKGGCKAACRSQQGCLRSLARLHGGTDFKDLRLEKLSKS